MSHQEELPHQPEAIPSSEHPYCLAARYRHERDAGRVYTRARDTLFNADGCDLSAYRLRLDQIWHVAVLGARPPQPLDRRLRLILAGGDPVTLPDDIVATLLSRRSSMSELGPWVERRHNPGHRL